ncbi:hypothetical protein BDY19DRAFT_149779 [Irpex rosettiformis]|uniref:Uncharacterized protein n=1 Tax=Irpex rosettiformis TaxID=378272 RepID=A0ACB8U4E4_9APHY|nr:hypothetical protein BDY19DRAFT_149779 [Irpex rosettiformis]
MATDTRNPTTPSLEGDWDRWTYDASKNTSQNSVQFPGISEPNTTTQEEPLNSAASSNAKRTLSALLKLHAERGTDVNFSPEEADRVAEVLNRWINSSSSPYEADDDFFNSQPQSQDDSSILLKRSGASDSSGRPRGRSESVVRLVPS